MKNNRLIFAAALLFCCAPAFAQVSLEKAEWQFSRKEGKKNLPFETVSSLRAVPGEKLDGRLMAIVTVKNSGQKAADALVLRYALSMRLHKQGEASGVWPPVPYHFEEVRVLKLKPGEARQVRLIHSGLGVQMGRLRGTGFWFDALKLAVMAGPRAGDDLARITLEAELPVTQR